MLFRSHFICAGDLVVVRHCPRSSFLSGAPNNRAVDSKRGGVGTKQKRDEKSWVRVVEGTLRWSFVAIAQTFRLGLPSSFDISGEEENGPLIFTRVLTLARVKRPTPVAMNKPLAHQLGPVQRTRRHVSHVILFSSCLRSLTSRLLRFADAFASKRGSICRALQRMAAAPERFA